MPHMHWLGKDFTFTAVLPDGKTRIPLIKIDHWNFNWQGTYAFKEPIRLPKGSWFEMEAHFDNTDSNPSNQSKPAKLVKWGEGTNDEMCIGIYEWVPVEGDPDPPDEAVQHPLSRPTATPKSGPIRAGSAQLQFPARAPPGSSSSPAVLGDALIYPHASMRLSCSARSRLRSATKPRDVNAKQE